MAQTVFAVPDVVSEIRDSGTRQYLQVLPFDFKLKDPISDSIKFGRFKFKIIKIF